ncbi:MAG: 30S ribosomal protein S5, partial [Allosphingosinicella sp.]
LLEAIHYLSYLRSFRGARERDVLRYGAAYAAIDAQFVDDRERPFEARLVLKGGKRFGFAALVVVGDGKGRSGFGHGKAREVPEAISKATAAAKKAMVRVPLREGRTLHHDGMGHFGAGRVYVRSAPAGTGIIAGGPMRAVFESLGVADVVTKSVGTSNPYNMIRATFEALTDQTSPKSVAQRRGKKIADLLGRGGSQTAEADAAAVTE